MSYEGYDQVLCASGHLRTFDAYDEILYSVDGTFSTLEQNKCSCGAPFVWWNAVNETNGMCEDGAFDPVDCDSPNGDGCDECPWRIDGYVHLEIDKPEETEKCPHCGNVSIVKEVTYKIPTDKGHRINVKVPDKDDEPFGAGL